jgi:chemotaxis protein CheX
MEDRLYRAFVDATKNVFSLMLAVSEISAYPADDFRCEDEIDIAVGIDGDLRGDIIYRFPVRTSLNIVNIMSGMQFEEADAFVTSAISEIANIISGNVLTALSDDDINCDISPPVQCKPDEEKEYDLKTSCCIYTDIGDLCLKIGLNRVS